MTRGRLKQVTVLLDPDVNERFTAYCENRGFKKSTLIARLVRQYLDCEDTPMSPAPAEEARSRDVDRGGGGFR